MVSGNQWRFEITSVKPCPGRSSKMCSITGRFTTGTTGFGTS